MSRSMLARFAAAVLLPAAVLSDGPVRAADDATCDRYAAEAVSAAAQNAVRMCGFRGPAWGTDPVRDYNGHLNWCLGARKESVDQEAARRRQLIDKCGVCVDYARLAVDAFNEQEKLFCGNPSGPRWSANYGGHLRWCIGADSLAINVETGARSNLVGRCAQCDAYAKDAMRQRQEAEDNRCGFGGARWTNHQGGHKFWCMEAGGLIVGVTASSFGRAARDVEREEREQALNDCKQCRGYARTAAAQAGKARLCFRLSGARWSTSEDTQFKACMAFDRGTRDADLSGEAAARDKVLGECKVGVSTFPAGGVETTRSGAGASQGVSSPPGAARRLRSAPNRGGGGSDAALSGSAAAQKRKPAKVLAPGLLESDTGLRRQGPAALGAPAGGAPPGAPSVDSLRLR